MGRKPTQNGLPNEVKCEKCKHVFDPGPPPEMPGFVATKGIVTCPQCGASVTVAGKKDSTCKV